MAGQVCYASASALAANDCEYMVPAYDVICELLDATAAELEEIGTVCASLPPEQAEPRREGNRSD